MNFYFPRIFYWKRNPKVVERKVIRKDAELIAPCPFFALELGVPLEGVCLYPIVDFPGWGDDRHCEVGLWGSADWKGERQLYRPLADELLRQQASIAELLAETNSSNLGIHPFDNVSYLYQS